MIHRSRFDLTRTELFLSGRMTESEFVASPCKPIDRALAAYAFAIAHPQGVDHAHRLAILPAGGEDWLLRLPLSRLFREVFVEQDSRVVQSMTDASRAAGLHYAADGNDVLLALPPKLVALSKRYENLAAGPVLPFYQRRMGRRVS